MKKILAMVLAAALCCGGLCAAGEPAAEIPDGYYEDGTGISFVIPEGWNVLNTEDADSFPTLFLSPGGWDSGAYLQYVPTDLWKGLGEKATERGYTRKDIGPEYMDNDARMALLVTESMRNSMILEEHNGTPYLVLGYHRDFAESGEAIYYSAMAITIKNAYLYMFSLATREETDEYLPAFEAWLDSVSFTE